MSRRGLEVWRIDGDPAPLARDNMLRSGKKIWFKCSMLYFFKGLLDDDRVLAGVLWRQFLQYECEDAVQLKKLVHYVRQQVIIRLLPEGWGAF